MTDKIKIFKNIFEGLDTAYGQTIKTDQFDERGKHKTKSYTVSQVPVPKIWEEHLKGTDPGLGIVPINKENKCKWGCIDIDTYPFDHKKFLNQLKTKNMAKKSDTSKNSKSKKNTAFFDASSFGSVK